MTWTATDRITRVNFFAALLVAGVALWPLLNGANSLILMVAVLVLVYQAWRLAMARHVRGTLDATGISKTIGQRTQALPWDEVTAARLGRFLGTDQLIVTTTAAVGWQSSDRWYGLLGAHELAVQVPADALAQVRELMGANGVPLA
jgi:hypothetical protein